jgi:pyrroline-5-carboxylate reductase
MKKLGFIGGGNMAEALIRGLIANKVFSPAALIASDIDPGRRRKLKRQLRIETTAANADVVRECPAVLIAVKPQNIDEALSEIAAGLAPTSATKRGSRSNSPAQRKGRLFISIAAGITTARIAGGLGEMARVIRVMPNAPAMVGQGMAAIVRGPGATRADETFALRIFRAVGDAIALTDENQLDAVTALSGSGPAYVYLFVKAMADAAVAEGLPVDLATRMALKTIRGAEENMRQSPLDAAELIRIVASPGGTTEAALRKFADANFSGIVASGVHAAAVRSRELGRS